MFRFLCLFNLLIFLIISKHVQLILFLLFLPEVWYPLVSADGSSTRLVLSVCCDNGRLIGFQSGICVVNCLSVYGFLSWKSMGLGRWILRSSVRSSVKRKHEMIKKKITLLAIAYANMLYGQQIYKNKMHKAKSYMRRKKNLNKGHRPFLC